MMRARAGWLRWLRPGLEVKRWVLLLGLGILVIDLAAAYFLKDIYQFRQFPSWTYYIFLEFLPRWMRGVIFLLFGGGLIVLSVVRLERSVLGPFLLGNQRSVAEVIYSFRTRSRGPRVVAIGGGTGMSALLRGLKDYTSNLAAIVTVADDGGSSGRLREEYRILPPGDFRQCLVALADAEPLVKELFNYRFKNGSLDGHSFGNLFIMAMAEVTGNFEHALRESGRVLAVRGAIIPSTLHDVTLVASVNGSMVEGESNIPMHGPISRVFLRPDDAELNPEAALALMNAEVIVVGPGSLYTSILPNLLVPGMVRAIQESPALKVFVCNVASQHGETDGYNVSDYLRVLHDHTGEGSLFDFAIVNSNFSHAPTGGQSQVLFDMHNVQPQCSAIRFIVSDVVNVRIPSHHDPNKLARLIMKRVWEA